MYTLNTLTADFNRFILVSEKISDLGIMKNWWRMPILGAASRGFNFD
jgi:hypothetical protein